ncbi:hypothetical protein WJX79_003652 [Trebouxia sp. C0005]
MRVLTLAVLLLLVPLDTSEQPHTVAWHFLHQFDGRRGSFGCGGRDGHRVDTSILFDSGATSNFVSPRLLKQLAVNYSPSSATLRLADASSVPILGA